MVYNAIKGLAINTKYDKTDYYNNTLSHSFHRVAIVSHITVYRFRFKGIVSCIYLILLRQHITTIIMLCYQRAL